MKHSITLIGLCLISLTFFSACDPRGADAVGLCQRLFPPGTSDCFGTQPGPGGNGVTTDPTKELLLAAEGQINWYSDGHIETSERDTYSIDSGSIAYAGASQVPLLVSGCIVGMQVSDLLPSRKALWVEVEFGCSTPPDLVEIKMNIGPRNYYSTAKNKGDGLFVYLYEPLLPNTKYNISFSVAAYRGSQIGLLNSKVRCVYTNSDISKIKIC